MEFNFSFNSYCNRAKRIFQPEPHRLPVWLPSLENSLIQNSKSHSQKAWTQEETKTHSVYSQFYTWLAKYGMKFHSQMWYPVYFGEEEYPGSLANQQIQPKAEIMRVSGKAIMSTQVAVLTEELQPLFKNNPLLFSPRCSDWQNYVLSAYILRERQKIRRKQDSFWRAFMNSWPSQFDILETWEEEELEQLQDSSLLNKAMENYVKMTECWTNFYGVACKFPDLFEELSITVNEFQWSWNIQTTRCFESENSVSMIVPYADLINHENTGVDYDVFGPDGLSVKQKLKQEKAAKTGEQAKEEEDQDLSSEVSSDYDYDVVFQDEVIHLEKKTEGMRLEQSKEDQKISYHVEKEKSLKQNETQLKEYFESEEFKEYWWGRTLTTVKKHPLPQDFEFVVKNGKQKFEQGSQIYLSYGNLSNRDLLLRYGFCLRKNKHNNVNLKMVLHPTTQDFPYKKFMLQKLFKLSKGGEEGEVQIQARCFKIYYQELNCNVIKFMKIINYERTRDAVQGVFETRSVSTQIKALTSYETQLSELLTSMGSSVIRDQLKLKNAEYSSSRQKWALIYRVELKHILLNQLKLLRIARQMLLRLKEGFTLDYAVMRVHDYEELSEVAIHRHMLRKYLNSLKKGLDQNKLEQEQVQQGTAKIYKTPQQDEEQEEEEEGSDEDEEGEEEEESEDDEEPEQKEPVSAPQE